MSNHDIDKYKSFLACPQKPERLPECQPPGAPDQPDPEDGEAGRVLKLTKGLLQLCREGRGVTDLCV